MTYSLDYFTKSCDILIMQVLNHPRSRFPIVFIIFIGILAAIPSLSYPYGRDQGIFALSARTILDGGQPYRDAFDFKPPGIFYIYAISQYVFGTGAWSIRLADMLWQIASALLLVHLAWRLFSDNSGLYAALIYLICYHALGYWNTAQPEAFLALLLLIFMILLTDPREAAEQPAISTERIEASHTTTAIRTAGKPIRLMAAGVFLGLAALCKYTILPLFLMAAIHLGGASKSYSKKDRMIRLFWVGLGTTIPLGLWCLYAVAVGIWSEFYQIEFVFAPSYVRLSHPNLLMSLEAFLWAILKGFGLPWWCHVGWISAMISWRLNPAFGRLIRPWLLAMALGLIGVAAQGKYFTYHSVTILPWCALLMGAAVSMLVQGIVRQVKNKPGSIPLIVCFGLVVCSTPLFQKRWKSYVKSDFGTNRDSWLKTFVTPDFRAGSNEHLAQYIGKNTRPNDAVYIWGFEPAVYVMSKRRCPSRFIYNLSLRASYTTAELRKKLIQDLQNDPPVLFIIQRGDRIPIEVSGNRLDSAASLKDFPLLNHWIKKNYHHKRDIEIFRILALNR